ncbi:pre-tRNA nuclear export protein [Sphagnurus paluster]|uniref:Pre-tRNA nuclear export protein n=1 Tax=Sphagnurus paluster TaxID=117069 RepID=A0A9P7FVA7_9AGAR|nr:pre-tRNA nuclear export protein [Sphagnurus paluster]
MEHEIDQVVQAIIIASDPTQVSLHQQALAYISNIQQNARNTWRLALPIFVDRNAEGSRKYPAQARFFALRVLDEFFDNRFEPLDDETFRTLQQALVSYIQSEYVGGSAEVDATFLRNKFSHTLTLFFLCTYCEQWPNFFSDLFTLIRPTDNLSPAFNRHISLLFFHIVLEISGEVADQMIKSARPYDADRHARWIDINLTVTPTTVPLLFNLLADTSLPIRLATSVALLRIVAKGLKEPGDKLSLFKVLSLGEVLDALEAKTRAQQIERGSETDEGEESYREALGKLLNALGLEIAKLTDDCPAEDIRSEASKLMAQLLPVMLRFLSDAYDDTCSTVFPLLQIILTGYKRSRKISSDPIDETKKSFLTSLLEVLLNKMKWDPDADPADAEEDDNAEFEKLRKELRTFLDSILAIDQLLVTEAVRTLSLNTITAYQNGVSIKWHDAELGIYLVYIFGEINKTGGKGRAAFCQAPTVDKDKRKATDYSEYPLTTHGEMLYTLVQSGIVSYPHHAVSLQFFETVSRYTDFFKIRKECIIPTLEAMVDTRGLHNQDPAFRLRLYYLFHRFIKEAKNDIPPDISANIIQSIRDLLPIQIELPEFDDTEEDPLTEAVKSSAFDSQLYLFETAGILCSLLFKSPEQQGSLLLSLVKPLMDELSVNLHASSAKGGQDIVPIVKIHHIIMALGNISKGFPDYPPSLPEGYVLPPLDVLGQVAQAILVCLEAMNVFKVVRDATRFAFARIIATAGPSVTHFIPPLMANLLAHFEPSELVDFMNFIGLLIHKLQKDMFDVLDQLIGPLSTHIMALLSQPISGTDDERSHIDSKKAYLSLLNNIMTSKLHGIFTSERNSPGFETLIENMRRQAEDVSDPPCQKVALAFLSKGVTIWGQLSTEDVQGGPRTGLPGFERFIYESLVPTAFRVPSSPEFNIKDGQMMVVLHEIANLLQTVCQTRGPEAYNYFLSVFLPSQNWPSDTALEFTTKLRDLDSKHFRKYFTDFQKPPRKHGTSFSAERTWAELANNIREIQNHDASNLSFEENYRFAYNMVLHKEGKMLYEGVKKLVAENLDMLAKDKVIPVFPTGGNSDPMHRSQEADIFLKALRGIWDDHTSNMSKLGQILKYMDRVHTKSEKVPEICEAGLNLFLKHIIRPPIQQHIVSAILNQVQFERDGYSINRSPVKGCVNVLQSLEIDGGSITVYKRDFEPAFLRESEAFYKAEGVKLLESCDAPEFLRRVEARFESEDSRTHHYLSRQTASPLRQILKDNLLTPHLSTIISLPNSGLDNMIDMDKIDDLARLYRLFVTVPEGLFCLKRSLKDSITRRGREINRASLGAESGEIDVETPGGEVDRKGKGKSRLPTNAAAQRLSLALKWVEDVLNLRDKFVAIWKDAFMTDREVESALNEAFQEFIDGNEKSPEFISLFIDDNLKKGLKGKTDSEVDAVLDKTITVFRFLTDKDVFERYYKGHLAKRLIQGRSVSDDAERGMLAKLKVECGFQFTQKLEGMFHDMRISEDTMEAYRAHLAKTTAPDIDFEVIVMTSTFWPMSHTPSACTFTPDMTKACKSFEQFYLSRHSGRRLTWQPSLGNADVRVAFTAAKIELNVSTFALVILLQFQDLSEDAFLTYSELKEATNIEDQELQRNLQSLACAKYKILKKHPPGRDIDKDDTFSFNVGFTSNLRKIKIGTISSKVESGEERKETRDRIDEERRHQTEACIVRIMKDRKHMSHNDLINEVTRQLAARFHPDPLNIKKRIEGLIEREYLERCDDRKSYNYCA